jgi:hypothetical protein
MNKEIPRPEVDPKDLYQNYLFLMLVVRCDRCLAYLDINPPYGEDYSWDWFRVSADQTREKKWWIAPFSPDGSLPMECLCPSCKTQE